MSIVTSRAWTRDFLQELDIRQWSSTDKLPPNVEAIGYYLGQGTDAVEVALTYSDRQPSKSDVLRAWATRGKRSIAPVLLVAAFPDHEGKIVASLCGPKGDAPPYVEHVGIGPAERLARTALNKPDYRAAERWIFDYIEQLDTTTDGKPGLNNRGLLATHELLHGVPTRSDWQRLCKEAGPLLEVRAPDLFKRLGYEVKDNGTNAVTLVDAGTGKALGVVLGSGEPFDREADRFNRTSPVSYALARAEQSNLPWVILVRDGQIRLYSTRTDVGVGRKGRTETFLELSMELLSDDDAGYLPLVFSASALAEGGSLHELLDKSVLYASDLASRLRDRIYERVVPQLAQAIADRTASASPTRQELDSAYEQALTVLFRLLFVAYAEDKELLPIRQNSQYRDHSLKRIAIRLKEAIDAGRGEFDSSAIDLWEDVCQIWRVVDKGNSRFDVPAYNGGLFSDDATISAAGASIAQIRLTDAEFGPALRDLLLDESREGLGAVDFRSLSVREFGTIYEGLLESGLSVAPQDLALGKNKIFVPASPGDPVEVAQGRIYFHNRSGARKSTGSYFTKPFAVEYLLDEALEPALDAHVKKIEALVDQGKHAEAARLFFDFKVADIAMGSGHFLVAAIDRIEVRLNDLLARVPIAGVDQELESLRTAALAALGDSSSAYEIETTSLLRRQIARRCIYGVDYNKIAVELSRLAIWIHTFVPGLPLSFLDHSLIEGDSTVGIATLDEVSQALIPAKYRESNNLSLLNQILESHLASARDDIEALRTAVELTATDVMRSRHLALQLESTVQPLRQLCDLAIGYRFAEAHKALLKKEKSKPEKKKVLDAIDVPAVLRLESFGASTIAEQWEKSGIERLIREIRPINFPVAFPEVFLRDAPGFDVVLGNPPWEKVTVDRATYWAHRYPGVKALKQKEQIDLLDQLERDSPAGVEGLFREQVATTQSRLLLLGEHYPGLGTGDVDLSQAFAIRCWQVLSRSGNVGMIFPRTQLNGAGGESWRQTIAQRGSFRSVVSILNAKGWMFDDAEHRYTVVMVSASAARLVAPIQLRGPFSSLEQFQSGIRDSAVLLTPSELRELSDSLAFPMLPSSRAASVFSAMSSRASLSTFCEGAFRPYRELDSANDKHLFSVDCNPGFWPVYGGRAFDIWEPDTGVYYMYADPLVVLPRLNSKRRNSARSERSAFAGLAAETLEDPDTLPCMYPRIVFRDVARSTDARTLRVALVPPRVILQDKAPCLVSTVEHRLTAFLLGVLSSVPLDWYVRCVAELGVPIGLVRSLPIPDLRPPFANDLIRLSGTLASVDERFAEWAADVGVPVGGLHGEEKDDAIARIDALVSHLYGLDESDVRVIFETFHKGWDYRSRLDAVLRHYKELA